MSGLVRGKIECFTNTGGRSSLQQTIFKNTYDFFASHPNYTLIALNYGLTTTQVQSSIGGSGLGIGYYDQPQSFGYNAFFVVRNNATTLRPWDVYHMFQWSGAPNDGSPSFGSAPGNPGLVDGSSQPINNNQTFMGYAAAIGIGGTGGSALSPNNGNPWKGTATGNGSDTKGSTVWGAPPGGGSGVIIFPRSNDNYGSHRSLTQNMGAVGSTFGSNGSNPNRFHIVGDDDNWTLFNDFTDAGTGFTLAYSGLYTVRNGLTVQYPYCVIDSYNGLPWSIASESGYGDVAGTSTQQGGIVTPVSATVAQVVMDHYALFATDTNFWPDKSFGTTTYNMLDIPVGIYEPGPPNYTGFLGQIDFIREMYNVPSYGVTSDYSRVFIGGSGLQTTHWAIPWDKANRTVPRSGVTRSGVTFVTTSLNPNA